jgi:Kef-type K+ transport system membrane component KefB
MASQTDTTVTQETVRPSRIFTGYALLLVLAVVAFFVIRHFGEAASAARGAGEQSAAVSVDAQPAAAPHVLPHVLGALVVVIITARLLGVLFRGCGQPRVIGEVVAGIILGPSLLGRFFPETQAFLFPQHIMPALGILAQLGVILYMFLIGLELNSELIRKRAHATVAISHASIVAPFILGAFLALWLFPDFAPSGVPFTSFALFLGVAMAITAFPVLARILTDRGLSQTELGVIALSCAAADDVTAWCLLAFVVGVTKAEISGALTTVALSLGFMLIMLGVVRPVMQQWIARSGGEKLTRDRTAWVLVAVLSSALITEVIGIHAIFGGFLLGAVIPHDSHLAKAFRHKLEDVVTILLLPAFFAFTGIRTEIGLLNQWEHWAWCGVIILVATLGKFGGTLIASRMTGLNWQMSASLGILMNTRGLMELIVLNIGLDLGVVSPLLFAMMVLMALATTIATTPVLQYLNPAASQQQ